MRLPSPIGPPKTQPHGTKVLPSARPLYSWLGSFQRSTLNLTASALNGVPSWNVTPSRSTKFQTVASSFELHSVANPGMRPVPPGSKSTSRSVTWALTTNELPSCESTESSEDGNPLTP